MHFQPVGSYHDRTNTSLIYSCMALMFLKKTNTIFSIIAMLICTLASAQTIPVTGVVRSGDDQAPLIGVSVAVKGTLLGTATDIDGRYNLEVAPDAVLVFNYTGFEIIEVPVNGRSELNVTLNADEQLLEDVIVVGYKKEIK